MLIHAGSMMQDRENVRGKIKGGTRVIPGSAMIR